MEEELRTPVTGKQRALKTGRWDKDTRCLAENRPLVRCVLNELVRAPGRFERMGQVLNHRQGAIVHSQAEAEGDKIQISVKRAGNHLLGLLREGWADRAAGSQKLGSRSCGLAEKAGPKPLCSGNRREETHGSCGPAYEALVTSPSEIRIGIPLLSRSKAFE